MPGEATREENQMGNSGDKKVKNIYLDLAFHGFLVGGERVKDEKD